jgi:hypothetical protein
MISSATPLQPVHFRQLNELLSTAHSRKTGGEPILKRSSQPGRLLTQLEKELPVVPAPAVFRRLGRHTQLVLALS